MYFFVTLPQEIYVLTDKFSSLKVRPNPVPYVIFRITCLHFSTMGFRTNSQSGKGHFYKSWRSYISTVCMAQEVDLYTTFTLTDD